MPTAYDQVPYLSLPFDRSHPDQLAAMATLFGMNPAPPAHCRVLEIACADGGNLIPMACEMPECSFLGFDLASEVIVNGQRQIAELGLSNIRLERMDLMDAGPELGTFDYIIAHGLYSWVPEPVRDKLMAAVKALLAPQGVAYISYNALPGCRIREMFREMLLFHLRDTTDPQERIARAREFLESLTQCQERSGDMGSFLRTEAQFLIEQGPVVLFHDELSEIYHPVYVHDFVAHAGRYGLQFLSEASFAEMQPRKYPQEVLDRARTWAGGDRVLHELYGDFLRGRTFRRTLLCHEGVPVSPELIVGQIPRLWASSPAEAVSAHPILGAGAVEEFRGPRGAGAKTAHPLAKAALVLLTEAWPECLSFEALVDACSRLTAAPPDPAGLVQILSGTFAAGLVELHALPPRCTAKPGPFPKTTDLARWQARHGSRVTTLRHTTIEAEGEVERRLLSLLDGTRDLPALVQELSPLLSDPPDAIARKVQDNLGKLARFSLLVA